jgi:hypothetical protein
MGHPAFSDTFRPGVDACLNDRWTRRLLPAALAVSLVWGGWQYFRWWRTCNYWANQYVGGLVNAGIGFDRLRTITDPGDRSLQMAWVYGASASTTGDVLDVMTQAGYPHRPGILWRVDLELGLFTRNLWQQRGLKPPEPGSRQNDLLPAEDLDKLARVEAIYRNHFTAAVVGSLNYERHRRTLIEAHQQLEEEGLTKLLSMPDVLNQGL